MKWFCAKSNSFNFAVLIIDSASIESLGLEFVAHIDGFVRLMSAPLLHDRVHFL